MYDDIVSYKNEFFFCSIPKYIEDPMKKPCWTMREKLLNLDWNNNRLVDLEKSLKVF